MASAASRLLTRGVAVPWMRWVRWPAPCVDALRNARALFTLDVAVMVPLAARLPVLPVPEQPLITTVRLAVVHHRRRFNAPFAFTALAQRVFI